MLTYFVPIFLFISMLFSNNKILERTETNEKILTKQIHILFINMAFKDK